MASSVIGALSVEVSVDAEGVKKGIKASGDALKIGAKQLRESANEWAKWGIAAAAASAAASAAIVKSNLSSIRELKNQARAANTLTSEFQRGAFAAKQFGIEQDKYADILKDTSDRVGDFLTTGAGPMVDFFEKIAPKVGVTAASFKNLSGQDALGLYVSSLEKANLNQNEMAFYMEAMASDSTRLIPLFTDNGKAMGEMAKEAADLGVGLSEIDVAKAIDAQNQLDKISSVIDSGIKNAVVELAPLISVIADEALSLAKNSGGFGKVVVDSFGTAASAVGVFADGIHGIKVILKGVEVAFRGFSAFIIKVVGEVGTQLIDGLVAPFRLVLQGLALFSSKAKSALNTVDAGLASINKGVDGFAEAQIQALAIAKDELHNLAMEELPSEAIDGFIQGIKDKAAAASLEIAASLAGKAPSEEGEGGEGTGVGESREAERIRAENESMLEAMLEGSALREETLLGRFTREQEILQQALNNKLISEEEYARASKDLDERLASAKVNIMTSTMDALVQGLSIGGKKAQKIQKGLAIVSAVMAGKESAILAWKAGMATGGPYAPIVAAAYTAASIAKTGAMISSIKSGGSSGGGGGGGAPSVPSQSPATESGGGSTAPTMERRINVNFAGEGLMSTEQVRGLMSQINEQLGDGVQLLV